MLNTLVYGLLVGGITSIHAPALKKSGDPLQLKAARKMWAIKFALFSFLAALFHYGIVSASSQIHSVEATIDIVLWLLLLNFFMKGGDAPFFAQLALSFSLMLACFSVATNERAAAKFARIGHVERVSWSKSPPPLDLANISLVSHEQALVRGQKVLKESFGDRYRLGSFTLQKVNGSPVWVAPLECKSFGEWLFGDYARGVVVVDAQDPNAAVRVVSIDSKNHPVKLVFTPGAFFESNLLRHINRQGGVSLYYRDAHLELDDELKPWWVVFGYRPGYNGNFKDGGKIVLVDPETGSIQEFTPESTPSWVDVLVSRNDLEEKITDSGTSGGGVMAALFGARQIDTPSTIKGQSVWMINGSDGRSYYYAGLRLAITRNDRLTSFTLTEVRSGKTIEYPYEGATGITPATALEMVNKKLSSLEGASATSPLLCFIDGRPVYVVSIIDEKGTFKKVGLVDAQSEGIALGDDKESALREFKKLPKMVGAATS
jgi:hypothetical protein